MKDGTKIILLFILSFVIALGAKLGGLFPISFIGRVLGSQSQSQETSPHFPEHQDPQLNP